MHQPVEVPKRNPHLSVRQTTGYTYIGFTHWFTHTVNWFGEPMEVRIPVFKPTRRIPRSRSKYVPAGEFRNC